MSKVLQFSAIAVAFFGAAKQGDAQLFRRLQVRQSYTSPNQGHWSFPGRIQDHLSGFHGQDISGLSYEQMLSLHDAIHEGRPIPSRVPVRQQIQSPAVLPRQSVPVVQPVQTLPSV